MNRKKVKQIVKFSLQRNIQNKWFVILNVLLCIMILALLNAKSIGKFLKDKNIVLYNNQYKILYIDKENLIQDSLIEAFKDYEEIEVSKIEENNFTDKNIDKNIIVEVESSITDIISAKITSKEGIDSNIYDVIVKTLEDKRLDIFSDEKNINKSEIENLQKGISIERFMLAVDSKNSDKKEIIQYISSMIVYLVSIFIFSKIANDIAQEKVSKSIEYVLTSVSEKEYLLAKILSVILLVLIQGIYLLIYYFIGTLINNFINNIYMNKIDFGTLDSLNNIDLDLIKYILIVFVYGILTIILMSIIQAALSSKTTSMQEAGNSMIFLLTITISVYILTFVLIKPYINMSLWIYMLSCIPLISNFFIPAIIIIGQANKIQIAISLILLIISIPISFNICSKIFKNGVLDYKENKKRNVKKQISLLEEQEIKIEKVKFRKLGFIVALSIILLISLEMITNFLIEIFVNPIISDIINENAVDLISESIVSIIGLGLASYFVHLFINKYENTKKLNKLDSQKLFFISISLVAILQIFLAFIEMWFGIENNISDVLLDIEGLDSFINCILFFIEVAVVPAIFEELFFRKSMINLTRNFGEKFSIVFSSFIFAIIHLNFSQAIFAFLMGLILGILYVKTGTMKYNCMLHLLNNGYAAVGAILLFNKLNLATIIFEFLVFLIVMISGIVIINEICNKLKNREKIIDLGGNIIPKNFKYIFTDYTMIITIALTGLLFTATEMILKNL